MTTLTYRGYVIEPTDPVPPIPTWRQFAWSFAHPDFDGAEDSRDPRCGHAESPEACKAEIDWIEDDLIPSRIEERLS